MLVEKDPSNRPKVGGSFLICIWLICAGHGLTAQRLPSSKLAHVALASCQGCSFAVLGMCFCFFSLFGSVHFYWGSAKSKVFCYHTKSRDGSEALISSTSVKFGLFGFR